MSNKTQTLEEVFGSDEELERDGVFTLLGDARIKLAYAGGANVAFERRLAELAKPYQRVIQHGLMDPQVAKDIEMKAYVETVIKSWETLKPGTEDEYERGIKFVKEDGTTELRPDNPANRTAKLKSLPKVWKIVQEQANNAALYREILREEDLKN